MKKVFLLISLIGIMMVSCNEQFDIPEFIEPTYNGTPANVSIYDIQQLHKLSGVVDSINDDLVFDCIVVGNDKSGNIFKKIYVQDETGGYDIALDKSYTFNDFPIGQRLFITCQGMVIGDYGGLPQLGCYYINEQGQADIGRIPNIYIDKFLHKDGFPMDNIEPTLISSAADLTNDKLNTLVRFDNITFNDGGRKQFAPEGEATTGGCINRIFVSNAGNITLRTSTYADFAKDTIPMGTGSIIGILTKYNSTWQFILRSIDDLKGFSTITPSGDGSKNNPYNITSAIINSDGREGWVKGYIVGTATGYPDNITGIWTSPFMTKNIILLADSPDATSLSNCYRVQLPAGNIQDELNLSDHPENHKKMVLVYGTMTNYYGGAGMRSTNNYEYDE